MQNAGIAALGLNWRYLAFEVRPEDLRVFLAGAAVAGFIGLNLTVPHKILAAEMVDVVDEGAKKWGAVNTIVFEARDGAGAWRPLGQAEPEKDAPVRSRGYNTDADAIVRSLREDFAWGGFARGKRAAGGRGRGGAGGGAAAGAGRNRAPVAGEPDGGAAAGIEGGGFAGMPGV